MNEIRTIEPDYKLLSQFLQGWIAGRGYAEELIKDMEKLGCSFMPRWLIPKDSKITDEMVGGSK
jgi:hypothetical protein